MRSLGSLKLGILPDGSAPVQGGFSRSARVSQPESLIAATPHNIIRKTNYMNATTGALLERCELY